MKIIINLLRDSFGNAGRTFQIGNACRGNSLGRSEMQKQGFFAPRTYTGNFIKGRNADCLSASASMPFNSKAVRLITKIL